MARSKERIHAAELAVLSAGAVLAAPDLALCLAEPGFTRDALDLHLYSGIVELVPPHRTSSITPLTTAVMAATATARAFLYPFSYQEVEPLPFLVLPSVPCLP